MEPAAVYVPDQCEGVTTKVRGMIVPESLLRTTDLDMERSRTGSELQNPGIPGATNGFSQKVSRESIDTGTQAGANFRQMIMIARPAGSVVIGHDWLTAGLLKSRRLETENVFQSVGNPATQF